MRDAAHDSTTLMAQAAALRENAAKLLAAGRNTENPELRTHYTVLVAAYDILALRIEQLARRSPATPDV